MIKYKDLLNTNEILNLLINELNFIPKNVGKSIFFICPFHQDKKPSLSFEPNKKIFTCFSCNFKSSNIFSFWSSYKKITLKESLKEISKLGYFPYLKIDENLINEEKNLNLNYLISNIYQHNLFTKKGEFCLKYLDNRGIDKKSIENFSLGCSIHRKQLTNIFNNNGNNFSLFDLIEKDIVSLRDKEEIYDFFPENSIIIPLKNENNEVISFCSRITKVNCENKYIYLPSNEKFRKNSFLYNYWKVKNNNSIKEFYLVEGFFDVISLEKKNIENCIALLGTSISEDQLNLLKILKKRIVVFLDDDKTGREATIKIILELLFNELDCELLDNNYRKDPDDICKEKEIIYDLIKKRKNPYIFILETYYNDLEIDNNPQRIGNLIEEISKIFHKFKISVKNYLIDKLSLKIKWTRKDVEKYFIKKKDLHFNKKTYQLKIIEKIIKNKEEIIICLFLHYKYIWLKNAKKYIFFSNKKIREKYEIIYVNYNSNFGYYSIIDHECRLYYLKKEYINGKKEDKVFDKILSEINITKKFLKNYEKQNY